MVGIIDYGLGNLASIQNMLKKIDIESIITSNRDDIIQCTHLILPGVGSFDVGMSNIRERKLDIAIHEAVVNKGIPILGICLGMQLLGMGSEEGLEKGLSLIDMQFLKFNFDKESNLKVPHMGWNTISLVSEVGRSLFDYENPRFYFVHSYYCVCKNSENVMLMSNYGFDFVSGVQSNNVYGVQFHPEKSHKFGMDFLSKFFGSKNWR